MKKLVFACGAVLLAWLLVDPVSAQATGACCVSGTCSILTSAQCATAGGVYKGDGTICSPSSCDCCNGLNVELRGNADNDGLQRINVLDILFLVNRVFKGGPAPQCATAADVNASGSLNIVDIVDLVRFVWPPNIPPAACP